MKVIHISPSYYPAVKYGGPVQSVHLLNKFLVRNGCDVDVLTTNAGLSRDQKSEVRDRWNIVDGVRVKYVKFIGYEHYNFSLSFLNELRTIINHYDLVHITAIWNFPVLIGCLLSIINKKPFIISPRGALYRVSVNFKRRWVKRIYFNLLIKNLIKKSSSIHFTSKSDKDRFFEFVKFDHKHFIIPNGIEVENIYQVANSFTNSYKFNVYKDKKYILFLGRINPIKGLDILLGAFSKISAEFKDLFLILAGPENGNYNKELKQIINSNKLDDRVYFTGILNFEEKIEFLKNATIFVLPSYSENFGMSAIEALACGIPTIISNKVGICEKVEQANSGIVIETNVESLKAGIEKILIDSEYKKIISDNAIRLVKELYDINNVSNQMISQYVLILKNYKK